MSVGYKTLGTDYRLTIHFPLWENNSPIMAPIVPQSGFSRLLYIRI